MPDRRACRSGQTWCDREEACLPDEQFEREGDVTWHLVRPLHDTNGDYGDSPPMIQRLLDREQ